MPTHKEIEDYFNSLSEKLTPEFFEQLKIASYKRDREYPENFSNWYSHIKDFGKFKHAEVLYNQILTLEDLEILQEEQLSKVDWNKLQEVLQPTISKMTPYKLYNLKNGCYSNKFDFETSIVDTQDIAQKLWKINYESSMKETGGFTEVVLREFIPSDNKTPTIYHGMPLRTEVRIFYNMETKKIEYAVDYWDYDYCSQWLNITDRIVFDWYTKRPEKTTQLEDTIDYIYKYIDTLKFDETMKGIWSIDFMLCNNKDVYENYNGIYLIDMARGFRSAYWDPDNLTPETKKLIEEKEQNNK